MKINMNSYAKQSKRISVIENFVVIYFILGMFFLYEPAIIISYIISILLQLYTWTHFLSNKIELNRTLKVYAISMLMIFFITIVFIIKDVEITKIINRIGPLISVFGLSVISMLNLDIYAIGKKIVNFSCYLLLLIDVDAVVFMITGNAIWEPIRYIGYRYSGFFADPNMMSFFSASILLLLMFYGKYNINNFLFKIICLTFNVVMARSLSGFIILGLALVIPLIIKIESTYRKQIFILIGYVVLLVILNIYGEQIKNIMINIFSELYESTYSATVKYISFEHRIDAQTRAINIFFSDIWGQGPLQLVRQLGVDTHNSYIGITFEQGIFGLVLILISVNSDSKESQYNIWIDRWGYFIMIFALVLNVHYTTVNALFLLYIHGLKIKIKDNKGEVG